MLDKSENSRIPGNQLLPFYHLIRRARQPARSAKQPDLTSVISRGVFIFLLGLPKRKSGRMFNYGKCLRLANAGALTKACRGYLNLLWKGEVHIIETS